MASVRHALFLPWSKQAKRPKRAFVRLQDQEEDTREATDFDVFSPDAGDARGAADRPPPPPR